MADGYFENLPSTNSPRDAEMFNNLSQGWTKIKTGHNLTFSSADSPTFVVSTNVDLRGYLSVGMKLRLTHESVTKYFIITAITSSSITLYGGTDYTLSASAISNVFFSVHKSPYGFPLDPDKFRNYAQATTTSNYTLTSASNQTVPLASISQIGGLLTLESNGIKINGHIKRVKVSAYMFFENFETTRVVYMWPKIYKNSTNMIGLIKAGSLTFDSAQIIPLEIEVTAGDIIKLIVDPGYVSGQSGTFLRNGVTNLSLIVEVVE